MNKKYGFVYYFAFVSIFLIIFIGLIFKGNSREDYFMNISSDIKLSSKEKKVDEYLTKIKKEADKLYSDDDHYGIIDWEDTIYSKELYEFSKLVPKGGDLHVHSGKVISVSNLIDLLLERDDVYIVLKKGDNYGFLHSGKIPKNAIKLSDAINSGKITVDELKELIILSDNDSVNSYWDNFDYVQNVVGGLNDNPDLLRIIYEEGFRNSCENNACFLEVRLMLTDEDDVNIERLGVIRDAYYNVKDEYPEFVVRIIACTSKKKITKTEDNTYDVLLSVIRVSNKIKDEYDRSLVYDFVIGFDLVGYEDEKKTLEFYSDILSSREFKKSGLKLFLHAGESLRLDNDSVIDAYKLNAIRVGHAFNLYRFPSLMKKYSNKKIAIEVSPISNYRLGYIHDLRLHPVLIYLQNDIPVVISSDDGLFFTSSPLVDDYYAAILSWNLNLKMIKEISLNSIIYSGLSKKEIKSLKKNWENDWNDFIKKMLEKMD